MYTPMTIQELHDLHRLLGKLRVDMGLDDGTAYRGPEIDSVGELAEHLIETLTPEPAAALIAPWHRL